MTTLVGSYDVLASIKSSDAVAIMFMTTLGAIFFGRFLIEGLPYQISSSAMVGDTAGFIFVIVRGQEILRRPNIHIPELLQRSDVHIGIFFACFVICVAACVGSLKKRDGQLMDIYHDCVIAPMFMYLIITVGIVILLNGSPSEMMEAGAYIMLWVVLVILDWYTGMIAQRIWLSKHFGIQWPARRFVIVWNH